MKESFVLGFVKRGMEYGLSKSEVLQLYKAAAQEKSERYKDDILREHGERDEDSKLRSGGVGRYLDMKAQKTQAIMERPMRSYGGSLLGSLAGAGIGGLAGAGLGSLVGASDRSLAAPALGAGIGGYWGGQLGNLVGAEAGGNLAAAGFSPEERRETYEKTNRILNDRSILGNMGSSALNMSKPYGLLGVLGGGIGGGIVGHNNPNMGAAAGALLGAGIGGLGMGALGAATGAGLGGINSLIHKNTSPATHQRSKHMVEIIHTQQPYRSAIWLEPQRHNESSFNEACSKSRFFIHQT